jgi:hypothetical protein
VANCEPISSPVLDSFRDDRAGLLDRSHLSGVHRAPYILKNMKKIYSIIIFSITILGVVIFSAVCWHSIEEIHYLKSFFPKQFSVQEACYAAAIELIKVIIIGLPIVLILSVSLSLWRHRKNDR